MGDVLDLPPRGDTSRGAAHGGRLSRTQRRAKVLRLIARGFTHQQVGEQLGLTKASVDGIVRVALERYQGSIESDIEEVRRRQLERLDMATAVVMEQVTKGSLKAVDRLVQLEKARARIAGTEAARRHVHDHRGRIEHGVDADEVNRLEREWVRSGGVEGTAVEVPAGQLPSGG